MKKAMRDVFLQCIYEKMKVNEKSFFVTADFGAPVLDKLKLDFANRFVNVGIAEQNLINVCAGIALEGYTVYAYAIAPFITMRAYEQIRNNLSMLSHAKDINVNMISVGAGVSYDLSCPSHHCLEDLAITRLLPNLMVYSPSDWQLCSAIADITVEIKKPKYIRLDGKPLAPIYSSQLIDISNGFTELIKGESVAIVATGYMTQKAMRVAAILNTNGVKVGVIDVYRLKPVSEELLVDIIGRYKKIITLEEGFVDNGGLDSIVMKTIARNRLDCIVKCLGFKDAYAFDIGGRESIYEKHGLGDAAVMQAVVQ